MMPVSFTRGNGLLVAQLARAAAWYATVLQAEGRTEDALSWAERTLMEAEAVNDADALGASRRC
jgi:hypothetical protein